MIMYMYWHKFMPAWFVFYTPNCAYHDWYDPGWLIALGPNNIRADNDQ